ncbi:MAG: metallophosphoesterase family protein [Phycisphaerales bacterium JB063]
MPTHDFLSTRRSFLGRTGLVLAGGCLAGRLPLAFAQANDDAPSPLVRLGFLTDVHYADRDTAGTRHYRDSLGKMRTAVAGLNTLGIDAAVVMGDLIDSANDLEGEINHLRTIDAEYARIDAPRHYVLGNHCVHTLTKEEFIEHSAMESPHSTFDLAGVRFIILDSCFTSEGEPYQRGNFSWTDANLPEAQLEWFAERLDEAPGPVVVLTHQRIDGLEGPHNVRNGAAAREIMEASGKVLLVMSGHSHRNLHEQVNGIDYVVIRAMVDGPGEDNNSFGRLLIYEDHSLKIEGHIQQADVDLA